MTRFSCCFFLSFMIVSLPTAISWAPASHFPVSDHYLRQWGRRFQATALFAKKKPASSPSKLQVKLLKPIPGTGQKGEVVMVTPAFYQNKLQPMRAAELISDDQVMKERATKQAQIDEINAKAKSLQERIQDDNFRIVIRRKTGPEGQLFGGIGVKVLLAELQSVLDDEFLKNVRVKDISGEDKKAMKGDIKSIGTYYVTLVLTKEMSAKFVLEVVPE